MAYLMKCGHVGTATNADGSPCCALCWGNDANIVDRECNGADGLEDRTALCSNCNNKEPSNWNLAFFEYRPDKEYDRFYCGCRGWD